MKSLNFVELLHNKSVETFNTGSNARCDFKVVTIGTRVLWGGVEHVTQAFESTVMLLLTSVITVNGQG